MIDDVQSGKLTLSARYLEEAALWCWDIHETGTGRLVESSWSSEWVAYESRSEAHAAGIRRLAELSGERRAKVA